MSKEAPPFRRYPRNRSGSYKDTLLNVATHWSCWTSTSELAANLLCRVRRTSSLLTARMRTAGRFFGRSRLQSERPTFKKNTHELRVSVRGRQRGVPEDENLNETPCASCPISEYTINMAKQITQKPAVCIQRSPLIITFFWPLISFYALTF